MGLISNLLGTSKDSFKIGTTTTLSNSGVTGTKTLTLPNVTSTLAALGLLQTFTAEQIISTNSASVSSLLQTGFKLLIAGADTVANGFMMRSWAAVSAIDIGRAGGTAATPSATVGGTNISQIRFSGHDGTVYTAAQAGFTVAAVNTWSGSDRSTFMSFNATPQGSISQVACMAFDGVGAVVRKGGVQLSTTAHARVGGTIYQDTTQFTNTAATETDAYSHSIAANTLNSTGEKIRFLSAGTFASTVSTNKRVKVVLGSTTIFDSGALAITSAASWLIKGVIIRTGSATQKCVVDFISSSSVLVSTTTYTSASETLTGALTLKLTLNGTLAADTVGEFYEEDWIPAAI